MCPLSGCSSPTALVSSGTGAIAVDSTNVYWTSPGSGKVLKCAIAGCGGNPTTLATGQTNAGSIAVDSTSVYWVISMQGGNVMKLTPK